MPSILATALQSACLKAAANLTAQTAKGWGAEVPQLLDVQRVLEFAIYGFVSALINFLWHDFLELRFPTVTTARRRNHPVPVRPPDGDDGKQKTEEKVAVMMVPGGGGGAGAADHNAAVMTTSWRNLLSKLVVDQTIGLTFNITLFLVITNLARLRSVALVADVVRHKLYGLVLAGWRIWPAVGIVNFLWVPVRSRVLFGACIGFGWNIFLSLFLMK